MFRHIGGFVEVSLWVFCVAIVLLVVKGGELIICDRAWGAEQQLTSANLSTQTELNRHKRHIRFIAKVWIFQHEGCESKPYQDTRRIWHIGVGYSLKRPFEKPLFEAVFRHYQFCGGERALTWSQYNALRGSKLYATNRELSRFGFSTELIELQYQQVYELAERDIETFSWWADLPSPAKVALLNFRFTRNPGGFRAFKKMNAALERNDLIGAAYELWESRWGKAVGQEFERRAGQLQRMIAEGWSPDILEVIEQNQTWPKKVKDRLRAEYHEL